MACASGRPKELGLQVQVVEVESARKAPQTPNAARVRLILINMLSRNQHQFPHAVHVHPIYNKSRMLTLGFLGAPLAPPPVILSRSSIDMERSRRNVGCLGASSSLSSSSSSSESPVRGTENEAEETS